MGRGRATWKKRGIQQLQRTVGKHKIAAKAVNQETREKSTFLGIYKSTYHDFGAKCFNFVPWMCLLSCCSVQTYHKRELCSLGLETENFPLCGGQPLDCTDSAEAISDPQHVALRGGEGRDVHLRLFVSHTVARLHDGFGLPGQTPRNDGRTQQPPRNSFLHPRAPTWETLSKSIPRYWCFSPGHGFFRGDSRSRINTTGGISHLEQSSGMLLSDGRKQPTSFIPRLATFRLAASILPIGILSLPAHHVSCTLYGEHYCG